MSFLCSKWRTVLWISGAGASFWLKTSSSVASLLYHLLRNLLYQSSAAVGGPQVNTIIACREINSVIFGTVTLILSQISEFGLHWWITSLLLQAALLNIAILETSIFQHYSNFKNYWANFDDNCKIYSTEVLVIEINGMINSDKFSRSYDDLYLGVTCLGHRVVNLLFLGSTP